MSIENNTRHAQGARDITITVLTLEGNDSSSDPEVIKLFTFQLCSALNFKVLINIDIVKIIPNDKYVL